LSLGLFLAATPALAKDTLYKRLGGYDAIAAVTDSFLGKLAADPKLGRFFVGHGATSSAEIRQMIVDFICNKTGGPCLYTGRSMLDAHTGLKITEEDWTKSVGAFVAVMAEFKVDKAVQAEVGEFVATLKPDIVGK
jgi:hemoglobin